MRPLRREMQMIFQDLDAGLNPKMRVRDILREALTVFERPSDADIERRSRELLEQVNLKESKLASFPPELSGGEKRRVGIARALAVRPAHRRRRAHQRARRVDPGPGGEPAARSAEAARPRVPLHLARPAGGGARQPQGGGDVPGRIVEMGLAETIARAPRHPYTQVLWSSATEKRTIEAGVFDFERPASGCRFAPRCPRYAGAGPSRACTASQPSQGTRAPATSWPATLLSARSRSLRARQHDAVRRKKDVFELRGEA